MNAVTTRLRLSLFARALVALGVLGSFSLVLSVAIGTLFGLLTVGFGSMVADWLGVVAALPRLSAVTPVPPFLVAVGGIVGVLALVRGWATVAGHTSAEHLFRPDPVSLAGTGWLLCCCYLAVVEGAAALSAAISSALSSLPGFLLVLLAGGGLGVAVTVVEVRREVEQLRQRLVDGSVPAGEAHPALSGTVGRLARQADVAPPAVHVTATERPESFTVGHGEDALLVVSSGLVEALPGDELEAVLAHEVSHLANGDSRVMGAALVPLLAAETFADEEPRTRSDRLRNAAVSLATLYGQFGVAVLSRGRELAADAGAAALTGSPAALASALERLDDERGRPGTDLRDWERSAAALDILPPAEREAGTGPFRTHPSTDARIDRLRQLAERAATD